MLVKASKLFCFFFFILLLDVGAYCLAFQEPVLEVRVEPREINLGERLQVTLSLRQEASGDQDLIETPNLALPPLDGFLLRAQQSESRTVSHNQGLALLVNATYILEPVRTGELEIPSLTLSYRIQGKVQEVQTQAIKVNVRSSFIWFERFFAIFWVFIAVVAVFVLFLLMRRLQRQKKLVLMTSPQISVSFPEPQEEKSVRFAQEASSRRAGPDFTGLNDAEATEVLKDYFVQHIAEIHHLASEEMNLNSLQKCLNDGPLKEFLVSFGHRYQRYTYGQQALSHDEREDFLSRFEKFL